MVTNGETTHMPRAFEGVIESVPKRPFLVFTLGQRDTEQLRPLGSLPFIPMSFVRGVIHQC